MIGHPRHVKRALGSGADLICAQAGEGGGHTGNIPASLLIPACADAIKGYKSPLTGKPVYLVGAGAIYDGRGLAANIAWGAQAVWVGTRFLASVEAGGPQIHKDLVVKAGFEDTVTTLIFTGRPARVYKTPFVRNWYVILQERPMQAEVHTFIGKRGGKRRYKNWFLKGSYHPKTLLRVLHLRKPVVTPWGRLPRRSTRFSQQRSSWRT
jgi:NAD(P)H-dependent flavin oxidoreductase YrpB (nitropropane dioxygenase family)